MQSNGFPKLEEVIKNHVLKAIEEAGGSKTKAAGLLGVSVKTVYNHVNRYNTELSLGSEVTSSVEGEEELHAVTEVMNSEAEESVNTNIFG